MDKEGGFDKIIKDKMIVSKKHSCSGKGLNCMGSVRIFKSFPFLCRLGGNGRRGLPRLIIDMLLVDKESFPIPSIPSTRNQELNNCALCANSKEST